jgi:predicted naringenin-chalcone synthase
LGNKKKKNKEKTRIYENKLFALITVIMTTLSFGQITEPQVDALVNKTLTAFNVPGIAVAIIKTEK